MESIEIDNVVWIARGFSSEECDSFALDNIFFRGAQKCLCM